MLLCLQLESEQNIPGHCPQRVNYEGSRRALSAGGFSYHRASGPEDTASFECVWTVDAVASLHGAMPISKPCSVFLLLKTPTNPASRVALHPYHPNAQGRAPHTICCPDLGWSTAQRSGRSLHTAMVTCRSLWSLLWSLKACPVQCPLHDGLRGERAQEAPCTAALSFLTCSLGFALWMQLLKRIGSRDCGD